MLGDRDGAGPLGRRVHYLPGWEVPPFEPLSPTREIVAARAEGLYHLLQTPNPVVVTTVEALGAALSPTRRVRRRRDLRGRGRDRGARRPGRRGWSSGATTASRWSRTRATWRLRGGILDVFPAGYRAAGPPRVRRRRRSRALREFDPASQRSLDRLEEVLLLPMREFGRSRLGPDGGASVDERAAELGLARQERRDLVEAVRSGLVLPGIEALLPYLYDELGTLADYLPPDTLVLDAGGGGDRAAPSRRRGRRSEAHAEAATHDGRFHPPPERLYLDPAAWRDALAGRPRVEVEGLEELAGDGTLRASTYATDGLALRGGAGRPRGRSARSRRSSRRGARGRAAGAGGVERARSANACRRCSRGTASMPSPSGAPFPQAARGAGPRSPSSSAS